MTARYPDAWSYSAYAMWEECPKRYEGVKVLKMGDQAGPGMAEGNEFHKQVADYIVRPAAPPPTRPIHRDIQPVVEQLRAMESKTVEQQWGLTSDWRQTGWFSRDPRKPTWLRVILDVGLLYPDDTAEVIDWKTGKRYDHNDDQMEVFAAGVFSYWRHVRHVTTRLDYVDSGQEEVAEFDAKDADALRAKWSDKAKAMLADRTFPARPGFRCKYCVRARQNGGDCAFG